MSPEIEKKSYFVDSNNTLERRMELVRHPRQLDSELEQHHWQKIVQEVMWKEAIFHIHPYSIEHLVI